MAGGRGSGPQGLRARGAPDHPADGDTGGPPPNFKTKRLLDRGTITSDEYETMEAKVLGAPFDQRSTMPAFPS